MRRFFIKKENMKKIIIIAIFGGLIIISAYFWGKTTGYKECQTETAKQISIKQNEIVKTMEKIDAETFNTGVSDIRQRLRENWTIHD
jgi:nitrogen fixation-related uncharacterized protein